MPETQANTSWGDTIKSTLAGLLHPLVNLHRLRWSPPTDATGEQIGAAWRAAVPEGGDLLLAARRFQGALQGAAIRLDEEIAAHFAQMERDLVPLLADPERSQAAGLLLVSDFAVQGRLTPPDRPVHLVMGLVSSLPAGHWARTFIPESGQYRGSDGGWLVLGPVRSSGGPPVPQPFYTVETVLDWTRAIRQDQLRQEEQARWQQEAADRQARLAQEHDYRGQIARLDRDNRDLQERLARLEAAKSAG